VDTGVARISRYSVRTKVQRLPVEAISQASANQRSGRCGRLGPGIAIRLYSEEDFQGRPEFTDPEILRTNLASVILQMASLGLGDMAQFPFVEPPDRRNVSAGVQLLEELGAFAAGVSTGSTSGGRLSRTGRRLARLPIDPRLARMVLEAERGGCVREVIVIAAALSLQDPRERPAELRPQADQQHARFKAEGSDFLTWLNLWRYLKEQQRELSSSAFRRMCKREFLNYLRVREWQDFESQLRQVCKEMEIKLGPPADVPDADGIHQALLAGLLSHIGLLEERDRKDSARSRGGPREYLGARGARFAIFPGSGLHRKNPQFLMAGELVETSRLWARQNAAIKPEWAERLGAHLVKRTYSEPHWSKKRASVMAHERVTLYGVPLVADRLVAFGKVDVALSRELFIRHALVYGEWNSRHRFLDTNRRLLEEAEELEHRARRRDIVVDEHTLFDFYDARVGADVVSGAHFDQWWKQERRERPDLLTFDPAMLTHDTAGVVTEADYPEQWDSGDEGLTFPISYHFEPGADEDGLTIDVPVATLNRVEADDFSWNVPGLREELVTSLIRSLPKNLRVSFVPAPNKAKEFLAAVPAGEEPLLDALERWLRSTTGVVVPREAWDWSKIAAHLQPTYRVVDDGGTEQARGKDLEALKAPLRPQFEQAMEEVATDAGLARSGETTWAFGTLDESATLTRAGHRVTVFPALVDEGATVGLGVFGSTDEAEARHRLGVRRLLLLALPLPSDAELLDGLSTAERLGLAGTPYGAVAGLLTDVRAAVVQGLVDAAPSVRSEDAYGALLGAARATAPDGVRALLAELLRVLDGWRGADKALSGRAEMTLLPALADMKAQLERLVHPGFVAEAGPEQLRRYPTYLRALSLRRAALDQGGAAVNRDRALMDRIAELQESYLHQVAALPEGRPPGERLRRVRWMLEELRVSLWAQQLGTAYPVSEERIRKVLSE
jgi:ATP-dependent helicase HrpA